MKINQKITQSFFLLFSFSLACLLMAGCKTTKTNEIVEEKPEKIIEYIYGYNKDSVYIAFDTVQKNQVLSQILTENNIPFPRINTLVNNSKDVFDVRHLRPNKPYEIICNHDSAHTAKCLIYHPNKIKYYKFHLEDSMFVSLEYNKIDTVRKRIQGTIESSLSEAVSKQGGSYNLVNMLSEVYAWQIDFFGLQKGDYFKALYEELQVDGETVAIKRIIAAEFTHNNEMFDAYWFHEDSLVGYYNSDGESMRKSFLKAPLTFKRVSSKFSYRRFHPVHKVYKPHLGVDYAARSGTPVVAIGDGKIIKKGYSGCAGHMVKIKHNGTYTTGYLHFRAYAKGLHVGQMVKQGDVIGYVGSTGCSTGPHLDFRVWKNGKNIDPLHMEPTPAKALTEEQKLKFEKIKTSLHQELNSKS